MTEYSHLTDPARCKLITASYAGAILGNNPWMTREDAMRALVRYALGAESDFKGNIATEYGNRNEEGIIIEFQMVTGLTVKKSKFIVCGHEPIFGCSPDGIVSDGNGLECKAPFSLRNEGYPAPFKTLAEQPHYRDQVQFSLYVTGRPAWHFVQWCPSDLKIELELPCQQWRDESLPVLRQFAAELADAISDPELSRDYLAPRRISVDTPAAHKAIQEWDELKEQIELAQERQKDLLAEIVAMGRGQDALIAGRKLTKVERAGSVSYAKALKSVAPDLDLTPWTGNPTSYWKIS